MDITIFTIAFNGYGRFLDNWLKGIYNQTKKYTDIIVVLGVNHGTPDNVIKDAKSRGIKFINDNTECSMGLLINRAIKKSKSEWLLRIDVDDILFPYAIEEISKKEHCADAISLKFVRDGVIKDSPIINPVIIKDWRKLYVESGYVATKRRINNQIVYYEDNNFPNFPYLFKLAYIGAKFNSTDIPCVIYQKRVEGHSKTLRKPGDTELAFKIIDEAAIKYTKTQSEVDYDLMDKHIYDGIKLSIIVPVYNTEQYIKRCLDSIPLRSDIEIIIIDDGSTDKSIDIINEWILENNKDNKLCNVTLIRNINNLGVGATVNKGYSLFKGEYVITLCDDDYFNSSIHEFMNELTGEDLIYYNMEINSGKIWDGTKLPGSTKAYKKSIIGNSRRIDKQFGGDKVFYQEILDKNPTIKSTGINLYHYNFPREGSLMDKWEYTKGNKVVKDTNIVTDYDIIEDNNVFEKIITPPITPIINKENTNFSIGVYTIAYNDYGKFLPQWIKNLRKQTINVDSVVIVLGNNHGANVRELELYLKGFNYKIVYSNKDTMGGLRNEALDILDTEWTLYFSADDELLDNAISEVYNKSNEYDAVALQFKDIKVDGYIIDRQSAIFNKDEMLSWDKLYDVPGYIAVKRIFNNTPLRYEEVETPPNYPFLFYITHMGLKMTHSDNICAIYRRRSGSHGNKGITEKSFRNVYAKYIHERAKYYFELMSSDNSLFDIITSKGFNDVTLRPSDKTIEECKQEGISIWRDGGSEIKGITKERCSLLAEKGLVQKIIREYKI